MGHGEIPPIGQLIRAERLRRGVGLRALARAVGVSASLVSQIETGRIRPSVSTLYAMTGELGMSVADLLEGSPGRGGSASGDVDPGLGPVATAGLAAMIAQNPVTAREAPTGTARPAGPLAPAGMPGAVTTAGEREMITLDSGVVWELLGQLPGERVDFLRITYQPGSASSSGALMRHPGTEYGFLTSGALTLQLGDEQRALAPGDAVCFRSDMPHRYRNEGNEPAVGIWTVIDEA